MNKLQEFVLKKVEEYKNLKSIETESNSIEFFINNMKLKNIEFQLRTIFKEIDSNFSEAKRFEVFGKLFDTEILGNSKFIDLLEKDELINTIEQVVNDTAPLIGDNEQEKIYENYKERKLDNFNSKSNIIQTLLFEDQLDLDEEKLDDIFADKKFITPMYQLDPKLTLLPDKLINLEDLYNTIIENTKKVIELNDDELSDLGLSKIELIENYQLAVSNVLKSQKFDKNEKEFKDLETFVKTPIKAVKSKYEDVIVPNNLNDKRFRMGAQKHEYNFKFNLDEISGEYHGRKKVDDLDISVRYDSDLFDDEEEVVESGIEDNENIAEKVKSFNENYQLNINYKKLVELLERNTKAIDCPNAFKDNVKEIFNEILSKNEIAQKDILAFSKEFCSMIETVIVENDNFYDIKNSKTAGLSLKELVSMQKESVEKYKPISVTQYYINRLEKLEYSKNLKDIAFVAVRDTKEMLNDRNRNAVEGSRGFGYDKVSAQRECAAILQAITKIHEERPKNFWWRHPIRNYQEKSAIKNIKEQILKSGCKEETLNSYLNNGEIEEESYLQAKSDIEVFEKENGNKISVDIDEGDDLEMTEMINKISKQLNKDIEYDDLSV